MTKEQKDSIVYRREKGESYRDIADAMGLSENTVSSFCRRAHLDKPSQKDICKNCGRQITPGRGNRKREFCSDACRSEWWNSHQDLVKRKAVYNFTCAACGKLFTAYGNSTRKYCSHACYIADRYGQEGSSHE